MYSINNNKGVALIITFFVIIVLSITGLAFFSSSIQEKAHTQIAMDTIAAKYWADAGLSYINIELSRQEGNWVTHEIAEGTFNLQPAGSTPNVYLSSTCMIDPQDGTYVPISGNREFAIKVFKDPSVPEGGERMVLIQSKNSSITRLFAAKISNRNLYQYFIFSPYAQSFGGGVYNAEGGKIYVGGNITLYGSTRINDLSQLMTPNFISYMKLYYVPPENHHDLLPTGYSSWTEVYATRRPPYWTPNPNTTDNFVNHYDGIVYGENRGLLMVDPENPGNYITWDGIAGHEILPYNNPDIYYDVNDLSWINGLALPNRIGSNYEWNKYWGPTSSYGYPAELIATNHLNTEYQDTDVFIDALAAQGTGSNGLRLDEIIRERNTNGEAITALSIDASEFENSAQNNGIYITIEDGIWVAYINGICYASDEYGDIWSWEDCAERDAYDQALQDCYGACSTSYNLCIETCASNEPTIEPEECLENCIKESDKCKEICERSLGERPECESQNNLLTTRTFWDVNSTLERTVAQLNVAQMIDDGNLIPNSGIVWSDVPLFVSEATELPGGGTTFISPNALFLHGSFNTTNPQPASAISGNLIYTLSRNFDFPNYLPDLYRYPDYPYINYPPYSNGCPDTGTCTAGALNTIWGNNHADTMANLTNDAEVYNVSLVGRYGYSPSVLERWNSTRTINGAFIRLETTTFPALGSLHGRINRWCSYNNPLFPEGKCRHLHDNHHIGSTYSAYGSTLTRSYEDEYGGDFGYPPGTLEGISESVYVEIDNTDDNFNQVYLALCAQELE